MTNLFILALAAGLAILPACRTCPANPTRQPSPAPYKNAVRCGRISSPDPGSDLGDDVFKSTAADQPAVPLTHHDPA
ncbi:hypothetical protein [Desulfobacter latus]|uniref:Uncharacterized protein n=1 Tax=Desulfobacter latus TaxID=2292 RepID=A0A850TBG0_9BACT|nr:hypothetical protein [Desulfobacter latus]NWH05978.1 hypothetical protein [Desulfobacter latus]